MFKIGDIITGLQDNGYSFTNEGALMLVVHSYNNEDMDVLIIGHNILEQVGNAYPVNNTEREFKTTTIPDFYNEHPDYFKMDDTILNEWLLKCNTITEAPESYALSVENMNHMIYEMKQLLTTYKHPATDKGIGKIIDEWAKNKSNLISLFEKHPNYNGKFQIVFDHDYDRQLDRDGARNLYNWLESDEVASLYKKEVIIGEYSYKDLIKHANLMYKYQSIFEYNNFIHTINGHNYEHYCTEYSNYKQKMREYENTSGVVIDGEHAYASDVYEQKRKHDHITNIIYKFARSTTNFKQLVTSEAASWFKSYFPEAKIIEGQKLSRAVNKILCSLGIDKCPNYNKEFAKFADACNPIKVKRHTVISVNPLDYLTMSFGNSWSSCHTIDKSNIRRIDGSNGYSGAYCSGTLSYMLDSSSFVFYTVDAKYNGNELEKENKINRCMFHFGDNRLVQGRVYPKSNDTGADELYKDIREIVQKVMADILEVPNYWTNRSGYSACTNATYSFGTHYKDYANYGTCNVSTLKDDRDAHLKIEIGHDPICPSCGKTHRRESNLTCSSCK